MTTLEKNTGFFESLKDLTPELKITDYIAQKHFPTFAEFFESKELKAVYDGWQAKTYMNAEKFIQAWVLQNGDLFVHYKVDGIAHIKQETIHKSINSNGLYYASDWDKHGFRVFKDNAYEKCASNRAIWRNQSWIILF